MGLDVENDVKGFEYALYYLNGYGKLYMSDRTSLGYIFLCFEFGMKLGVFLDGDTDGWLDTNSFFTVF